MDDPKPLGHILHANYIWAIRHGSLYVKDEIVLMPAEKREPYKQRCKPADEAG